ncbi:polysaccharide biosynthesis C-terminal domain-containing protein [uncultured Imperialibacter sp.]|uniref:oligosaccharide flippase family protein n=1 Tax=uncultured Imperialibacter sp. TaxID=1672639 RepID=UPI0030DAAE65|tara:strand:+ start:18594 stop:20078 length:1485 start_codon:yes stop_codon:yes gene_type:complete
MGVVIRQSFITTVLTYVGVVIGYVNVLILFPKFLTPEEIGLVRLIPSAAFLLLPLAQLGLAQCTVRFYPAFEKKKNGPGELLAFGFIGVTIGYLITLVLYNIFREPITAYFAKESGLVNNYQWVILAVLLVMSFQAVAEGYSRALLKIVAANFAKEVLVRVGTSITVLLYAVNIITFPVMVYTMILVYGVSLLYLLGYLAYRKQLSLKFSFSTFERPQLKEMMVYSMYALLGAGGSFIILNIDQIMISGIIGLSWNGIYTTAFYIAVVIEMPRRALTQITTPLISRAFDKHDMVEIDKLYKKVSINQMIAGSLLYTGIAANLNSIFALVPNNEAFIQGVTVVNIIGLGKLLDMTFSLNGEIIVMSKYFRFNVASLVILAILAVVLNLWLIPLYGIDGAAWASAISLFIYNLVKMIFVWMKLGVQPFTWKNVSMLVISGLVLLAGIYLPAFSNVFLDIFVRSTMITFLFGGAVLLFRISPDVNELVKVVWGRFRQ